MPVAAAFFVVFIWSGFVMLLSVTVAVIFEVYKKQHAFIILQEKVAQRQALSAAFLLLDVSEDGRCSSHSQPLRNPAAPLTALILHPLVVRL